MDIDFNFKIYCTCIYIVTHGDFYAFRLLQSREAALLAI